jgi:hypothetical protein
VTFPLEALEAVDVVDRLALAGREAEAARVHPLDLEPVEEV